MPTFAYFPNNRCRSHQSSAPKAGMLGAVVISSPVGLGATNHPVDVRTIQESLNGVPQMHGGANPPLKVDGIVGPKTRLAIQTFQRVQFPGWTPDSRVDPGEKTIARLNVLRFSPGNNTSSALSGKQSVDSPTAFAWWGAALHMAKINAHLERAYVRDAISRLSLIRAAYLSSSTSVAEEVKREADWHFKFYRSPNPVRDINLVIDVYRRMNEMLNQFVTDMYPLCRPGNNLPEKPGSDSIATAYTRGGGYYLAPDDFDSTGHGRFVYLNSPYWNSGYGVLIHELAHFCGQRYPSLEGEIEHIALPDPYPNGRRAENGFFSHNYARMTTWEARRNAYSYQCFSVPQAKQRWPTPTTLPVGENDDVPE